MSITPPPAVVIQRMEVADIPQVIEIDKFSFPLPWSERSYRHELTQNKQSHFFSMCLAESTKDWSWLKHFWQRTTQRHVIGYAGIWMILDEVHINTIAIHPDYRGHGLGEQLLVHILRYAIAHEMILATLEVRPSNVAALGLYRKYGFEEVGRRKRYYRDNGEDAILLTAEFSEAFKARLKNDTRTG
jgi:ribosomal-protein-alanine N-acetyltransferase